MAGADACPLEYACGKGVVAGEHRPSLTTAGGRLQVMDGDPAVCWPSRRTGHDSPFLVATTVVGASPHPPTLPGASGSLGRPPFSASAAANSRAVTVVAATARAIAPARGVGLDPQMFLDT